MAPKTVRVARTNGAIPRLVPVYAVVHEIARTSTCQLPAAGDHTAAGVHTARCIIDVTKAHPKLSEVA